eukprot:1806517-Karenia_brevis.AAC.1
MVFQSRSHGGLFVVTNGWPCSWTNCAVDMRGVSSILWRLVARPHQLKAIPCVGAKPFQDHIL